jgi:hypothetical protein
MIAYWLPQVMRNAHSAISFVPLATYSSAARLDVQPRPDTVIRVFMLFKR